MENSSTKKILIFRSANLKLTRQALDDFRNRYPDAKIWLVCQIDVKDSLKNIDQLFLYSKEKFGIFKIGIGLWAKIYKERFDLTVIPYNDELGEGYFNVELLALLCGAKEVAGYTPSGSIQSLSLRKCFKKSYDCWGKGFITFSKEETGTDYNPREYWKDRLGKNFSLAGVGYQGLGIQYNRWLYKARLRNLRKALRECNIEIKDKRILEVGCGTGFYIDFWKRLNPSDIFGIDITQKSVDELKLKYPEHGFKTADISSLDFKLNETFNIVTCFDVLFHIVNEESFERAIHNIKKVCEKKGYLLIADNFVKDFQPGGYHQKSRTYERYLEVLKRNSIKPVALLPIFFLMNSPVDVSRINNKYLKILIVFIWKEITLRLLMGRHFNFIKGRFLGVILYLLDEVILRFTKIGIGTKLLIARIEENADN